MNSTQHFIVVGIDGSESSNSALRWAAKQADLTGAALHAVAAWHIPATAYGPVLFPAGFDLRSGSELMMNEAVAAVHLDHPTLEVQTTIVEGLPGLVLLHAADGADMLVVGSRGHGAFTGMLLGSVSEHCVSHGVCPVVVIHASLLPV